MSRLPTSRDGVLHADLCIIGAGSGGLTLAAGAIVTLVLGLMGSLPALAARPARALRTL